MYRSQLYTPGANHDTGGDIYHDPADRDRAIHYSRIHEWLVLVSGLYGALLSLLALATGASARVRQRAERIAPDKLGPVMPYGVVAMLSSFLASLPLSYFEGYTIEHRYDLSNQTRRAWLGEQLKGLGIGMVIGLPVLQGVYAAIRRWPARWWAILAGLTVPFSIVTVTLAPVLLLPLFNKFEPLKNRALTKRIKDLAASQGVQVSEVLQMDMSKQTKKANAAFTGLGKTKRIMMGDTLLQKFSDDEVEVVLAHELGHQVHHDIWKLIALSAPTSVIGLYAAHRLTSPIVRRFGQNWGIDVEAGAADVAALPLLGLLGRVSLLGVGPLLNALVRNAVERPADDYALRLTGNRAAFISAMEKLGRMNLSNPRPSALVKYLLYDHPPLHERIEMARRYPG